MTSPQRIRVLTPEALDAAAANLINTANTQLRAAVSQYAGTVTQNGTTGVSTATPNAIIARDANARAQVASPSATADIATKGYVDTTVGGYIPTSQLAANSGVATLGSTGVLVTTQVPTNLERYLGSGTNWPTGARAGDKFTRSDVGCMFQYDGTNWWQATPCSVSSRTARNNLSGNSAVHQGFLVTQTDKGFRWRWDSGFWTFANWAGVPGMSGQTVNGDVYGRNGTVDTGTYQSFNVSNISLPYNTQTTVGGWAVHQIDSTHGITREWLTLGADKKTFTINDRCHLSVHGIANSDTSHGGGRTDFGLNMPGGSYVWPGSAFTAIDQRSGSYSGAGTVNQVISWSGYVNAGDTLSTYIYSLENDQSAVSYNCQIGFSIGPG